MKKKINEGALDLFLTNLFACGEQVEKIKDALEDHLGKSPNVNYGDVGDVSHVLNHLTVITDFLFAEGENESIEVTVEREEAEYLAEYWRTVNKM